MSPKARWPYCRVASRRRRAPKPATKPRAPRKASSVPYERDVLKAIVKCLKLYKCIVWRRNVGAVRRGGRYTRFGEKGQADLYGILPDGRHFECEVKRPGMRPRKDQLLFLRSVNGFGGALAFWAYSAEIAARVVVACTKYGARVEYVGDRGAYDLVYPDTGKRVEK